MKTSQCRRASGLRDDTAPLRPALTLAIALGVTAPLSADDWPMLGRDATRNPLSLERNPPVEWDVETGKNLRWKARVGSIAFADPVVAGGLVWIGSNNSRPWNMSTTNEAATLLGFRERDGHPVYQHEMAPLQEPLYRLGALGLNCSPLVEAERVWSCIADRGLCIQSYMGISGVKSMKDSTYTFASHLRFIR